MSENRKRVKSSSSGQALYQTPEELTEAQRAFYDSYAGQVEVYVSEVTGPKSNKRSFTVILVAPAISRYDVEMEWYAQNGIMESKVEYARSAGDIGKLAEVMDSLMTPLEDGMKYAQEKH